MRYVDNVDIMVPDVDVSQIQDFIRSIDSSEPPILDEALIAANVGSWFQGSRQICIKDLARVLP